MHANNETGAVQPVEEMERGIGIGAGRQEGAETSLPFLGKILRQVEEVAGGAAGVAELDLSQQWLHTGPGRVLAADTQIIA